MGILRVQSASGTSNSSLGSGDTVSATFSATVANNTLLAVLCHYDDPGTITAPSSWQQVDTTRNNGSAYISIWHYPNAPSTTTVTFNFNTCTANILCMGEYSGVAIVVPILDGTGINTGSGTSPATGNIDT